MRFTKFILCLTYIALFPVLQCGVCGVINLSSVLEERLAGQQIV